MGEREYSEKASVVPLTEERERERGWQVMPGSSFPEELAFPRIFDNDVQSISIFQNERLSVSSFIFR